MAKYGICLSIKEICFNTQFLITYLAKYPQRSNIWTNVVDFANKPHIRFASCINNTPFLLVITPSEDNAVYAVLNSIYFKIINIGLLGISFHSIVPKKLEKKLNYNRCISALFLY